MHIMKNKSTVVGVVALFLSILICPLLVNGLVCELDVNSNDCNCPNCCTASGKCVFIPSALDANNKKSLPKCVTAKNHPDCADGNFFITSVDDGNGNGYDYSGITAGYIAPTAAVVGDVKVEGAWLGATVVGDAVGPQVGAVYSASSNPYGAQSGYFFPFVFAFSLSRSSYSPLGIS
jgi:hypothetical protein